MSPANDGEPVSKGASAAVGVMALEAGATEAIEALRLRPRNKVKIGGCMF